MVSNRRPALKEKPNMRKISAKQFICMLIGFDLILLVIVSVKSESKIHKAPSASLRKTRVLSVTYFYDGKINIFHLSILIS